MSNIDIDGRIVNRLFFKSSVSKSFKPSKDPKKEKKDTLFMFPRNNNKKKCLLSQKYIQTFSNLILLHESCWKQTIIFSILAGTSTCHD